MVACAPKHARACPAKTRKQLKQRVQCMATRVLQGHLVVNVVKAVLVVFFFILDAYTTSCVVRNLGRTTTWLVLHEVADHLLAGDK